MERSSRFISLSGMSGVMAGLYALAGTLAAHYILDSGNDVRLFLIVDALVVLLLAVSTGIWLTTRKAKADGNSLFDTAAKKLIINLCIPLITGGIFCVALLYHGTWNYLVPSMLIFYGLALIHASKYTRDDIRMLGLSEIAIGCIALFVQGSELIFWGAGFGVLHIVYGTHMYIKYEK